MRVSSRNIRGLAIAPLEEATVSAGHGLTVAALSSTSEGTAAETPAPRPLDANHSPQHTRLSRAAGSFLDLLRAISAHAVVFGHTCNIYHFWPSRFATGSFGVVVFFLLSGFLITQSMLARANEGKAHLPRFLADRTARIMTPYIPALAVIALATAAFFPLQVGQPGLSRGPVAFLGNLWLLQDYPVFQLADLVHHGALPWRIRPYDTAEPFWTVAIEFWIYIAVGLLFFIAIRRERVRPLWVYALGILSIPVALWNVVAGGGNCLGLVWGIGALGGYSLFHQRARGATSHVRLLAGIGISCGAACLLARSARAGFNPFDVQIIATGALLIFSMTAFANTIDHPPGWFVKASTVAASYSYSLYLVHNSTIWFVSYYTQNRLGAIASAILACVIANLIAYGLYLTFERHHRAVAKWLAPRFERWMVPG